MFLFTVIVILKRILPYYIMEVLFSYYFKTREQSVK